MCSRVALDGRSAPETILADGELGGFVDGGAPGADRLVGADHALTMIDDEPPGVRLLRRQRQHAAR